MTDDNVLTVEATQGRPSIFIYETLSGVIFHITPISLPTLRAIQLKAQDLSPYPDPAPFRIPDPVDVAFTPGQASRAEDNPEYIKLCEAIDAERKQWSDRAMFDYCTKMPKYPTHEDLVVAYSEPLKALRKIAKIDLDDYETVLFHIVLSWNQVAKNDNGNLVQVNNEYGRILQLIIQTVALSAAEVAAGIRFFRPRI